MSNPYVVIFEKDKDNNKISENIYSSVNTIDELYNKLNKIITKLIKNNKKELLMNYNDEDKFTFGNLCLILHNDPYDDSDVFTFMYYQNNKWNEIKRDSYEKMFLQIFNKCIKN
jgi:hypothetical protein